ncbi:Dabb family protein [Clostridiales bacterium NSJ-32]|uniref:Dabb family protein n=1 Tax=Bianquea renquensis TaxID=2763661 RepID=A0A926DUB2_9FIRM|nr:Dabb family protein [Bianquea renquensis]
MNQAWFGIYVIHPAHVEAGKFVRSVVTNWRCVDFVEG